MHSPPQKEGSRREKVVQPGVSPARSDTGAKCPEASDMSRGTAVFMDRDSFARMYCFCACMHSLFLTLLQNVRTPVAQEKMTQLSQENTQWKHRNPQHHPGDQLQMRCLMSAQLCSAVNKPKGAHHLSGNLSAFVFMLFL